MGGAGEGSAVEWVGMVALAILGVAGLMPAIAAIGGWRRLAAHYRARHPFTGRTWGFQSLQLRGWLGYNQCVRVGADGQGVHFVLWPWLRIGHPALSIPWSALRARRERHWGFPVVLLNTAAVPDLDIRISVRLAGRLAEASHGGFPLPAA